jgi:hypothetical protein
MRSAAFLSWNLQARDGTLPTLRARRTRTASSHMRAPRELSRRAAAGTARSASRTVLPRRRKAKAKRRTGFAGAPLH